MSAGEQPQLLDRHAVLGEGARLVRADDSGAAQSLHGGQLFHDSAPLGHAAYSQSQHNGNDGGQALRDGGHRQGDGGEEHIQHLFSLEEPHPKHYRAHAQAQKGQLLRNFRHPGLEGGGAFLLVGEHPGNMAHLAVSAGGADHRRAPAGGDQGAGEDHVDPIPQRGVGGKDEVRVLFHRGGLAGHGALIGLQAAGGQEPGVGRDQVPGF